MTAMGLNPDPSLCLSRTAVTGRRRRRQQSCIRPLSSARLRIRAAHLRSRRAMSLWLRTGQAIWNSSECHGLRMAAMAAAAIGSPGNSAHLTPALGLMRWPCILCHGCRGSSRGYGLPRRNFHPQRGGRNRTLANSFAAHYSIQLTKARRCSSPY